MSTKKAKVLRDFKDAGTEKTFAAGAIIDLTEGEFTNYAACGLVEAASATDIKAAAAKA